MRSACAVVLSLLLSPFAFAQTLDSNRSGVTTGSSVPQVQPPAAQAQQSPSYANYSIMLVNPVPGGGAVVLMHNPKNELELVPVSSTKQALDGGYVAVRAVELGDLITTLKEENARLSAENTRLQNQQPQQIPASAGPLGPSQAQIEAQLEMQRREQVAAEQATRRQQLIQAWMGLQNMNRPQTFNVNVTDCTRSPALCVGK